MKYLLTSVPVLLLFHGATMAGAAEPLMENRILFGAESASRWAAAESKLEASNLSTRTGQPVLHWHITVDHLGGEANYPIGWPRISRTLREPSARDWSGWDYLQFWVYTDTSRETLPRDPVGLTLHTPDKEGAFNRSLDDLKKAAWVRVRIPLSEVPRHHDVRLMQFHIAESKYRHRDELDFYFDEIALLRYAQPALLDFTTENAVMFADAKQVPLRFNLAGVKPGTSVEVTCVLKTGGTVAAETKLKAGRGPQRAMLDLHEVRLAAGDYELSASIAGGTQVVATSLRLVSSPWQGKEP
jgi:hypothetical protein